MSTGSKIASQHGSELQQDVLHLEDERIPRKSRETRAIPGVAVFGCQLTTLSDALFSCQCLSKSIQCIGKNLGMSTGSKIASLMVGVTTKTGYTPRRREKISQIFEGNSPSHSMSHVLGVNSLPCCAAIFLPVLVKVHPYV